MWQPRLAARSWAARRVRSETLESREGRSKERPFCFRNSEPGASVLRRRIAPVLVRSLTVVVILVAASVQAAPRRVVFVDNRAEAGGIGSVSRPFATIDEAIAGARDFDVMH